MLYILFSMYSAFCLCVCLFVCLTVCPVMWAVLPEIKHTWWPKKIGTLLVRFITLSNIDQFSNFFYCQNQKNKICNNTTTKGHSTSSVSLHYLVNCQCLKSNN